MSAALVWSGPAAFGLAEWSALFVHFMVLSLLAVGGAISTVPDMHRFVVEERGWLGDAQFTGSVALAQAAPGPNVLFVAVIGFNVGGLAGVLATMVGTLLPSTVLALATARWRTRRSESLFGRAFVVGLAPLTIGLLAATGWVLFEPTATPWPSAALAAGTVVLMVFSRASPLWPVAAGAVLGALGVVG